MLSERSTNFFPCFGSYSFPLVSPYDVRLQQSSKRGGGESSLLWVTFYIVTGLHFYHDNFSILSHTRVSVVNKVALLHITTVYP
ncbi:hypothetical protein GDO81_025043 [Engystomops pustulosus]|uniref:Uncharacterized protein n=1 Tax=Engystomops pustulosus TaxID=76066 RepID=A0AAV6ZHD3_ENGPU|nr:hypothetical protein GDO81_025043 [Engystomops pustulosus]